MTGVTEPPGTLSQWVERRNQIQAEAWALLGDMPALFTPEPETLAESSHEGYYLQTIAFDNGAGARVPGCVMIPKQIKPPYPAVLYNHAHGMNYDRGKDEIFMERDGLPAIGPMLARMGYLVIAIDAYAFGERQAEGPGGESERGAATELSLFKKFLWEGATLWGMMLRDDMLALNYLLARSDVDPDQVITVGASLGGSRTTWLCALDDRPSYAAPVIQLTRYREFAATGALNLHSVYYYLPGALKASFDMEALVALAAPRPQTILIGDQDALSPLSGINKIIRYAKSIYALYKAEDRLEAKIYSGVDHKFTPDMQRDLISALTFRMR